MSKKQIMWTVVVSILAVKGFDRFAPASLKTIVNG